MATAIRATAANAAASGTAITVTAPTGTAAGDRVSILIAGNGSGTITDNNGSTPFTRPANGRQTQTGTGQFAEYWYRDIQSGDPSSYAFTASVSDRWGILAIAWSDPSATFFDVDLTWNTVTAFQTTGTSPAITTAINGSIHISVLFPDNPTNTCTANPSTTDGYNLLRNAGNQLICACDLAIATAGSVTAKSFTYGGGGSSGNIGLSFAVNPTGAGGGGGPQNSWYYLANQ